jgi:hypothetical protein
LGCQSTVTLGENIENVIDPIAFLSQQIKNMLQVTIPLMLFVKEVN